MHDQIINNFLLNRLIIPGSGYPALVQGGESGDVLTDMEGLTSVDSLIDRLCEVALSLSDIKWPSYENERESVEVKIKNNLNWMHHD